MKVFVPFFSFKLRDFHFPCESLALFDQLQYHRSSSSSSRSSRNVFSSSGSQLVFKKNTVFKPLSDRNSQFEKLSMLKCFFFLSSTCALEKKYGIILCALYRDILAYASRNNSKHGTNDLYVTRMTNGPLTVANLEKTRKLRNSSLPVISFLAKKNVRD